MASTSRFSYTTHSTARPSSFIVPTATNPAVNATPQLPPPLSSATKVLSSYIELPEKPSFLYSVYSPTVPENGVQALEIARRQLLSLESASSSVIETVLGIVRITNNIEHNRLWVFIIAGEDAVEAAKQKVNALSFEGLTLLESSAFTPASIYACSPACASLPLPCSTCQTSPNRFPRADTRIPYATFLDALRLRVLDQIVVSAPDTHSVKRLKHGFIMGSSASNNEWGSSWEKTARPLIYTHLQVYISPLPPSGNYQLVIHPLIRSTPYFFLPKVPSAGTPITLLPHATPAYFLARYTGPTAALSKSFVLSLKGLGVLQADILPQEYVIVWIAVENTQGEDKGISAIWPASLCLSRISAPLLDWIPELPAQLQPSPVPGPAVIPNSALAGSAPGNIGMERSLKRARSSRFDVRRVAGQVGQYVDAVAREREKERERIKREREASAATTNSRLVQIVTEPIELSLPSPGPAAQHFQQQQLQMQMQQQQQSVYPSPPQQANKSPAHIPTGTEGPAESPLSEAASSPAEDPTLWASASSPASEQGEQESTSIEVELVASSSTSNPYPPTNQYPSNQYSTDTGYNDDLMNSMDMDFGFGLGINMDMGMDMGLDDDIGVNNSAQDPTAENNHASAVGMSMDYDDAFTDDDFSFFDTAPSAAPPMDIPIVPSSSDSYPSTGFTPGPIIVPLGPPMPPASSPAYIELSMQLQSPPKQQSSPWAIASFTPSMLPPSPSQTPNEYRISKSAPSTPLPGVRLVFGSPFGDTESSRKVFEPIPFAPLHRVADGKYASGKFAFHHSLPSPPPEEEEFDPQTLSNRARKRLRPALALAFSEKPARSMSTSTMGATPTSRHESISSSLPHSSGWRRKYDLATDPRIGVVRKLIGARRKSENFIPAPCPSPAWTDEHKDWITDKEAEITPDSDSEEEDDDIQSSDGTTPIVSRPSTPLPPYLPLGPTLLHTQFQHSLLLPQSTPLRPPGITASSNNHHNLHDTNNGLGSVPTPVSPAAAMGALSEKSRSLEAAANIIAREVVENGVWADSWKDNAGSAIPTTLVWQTDVKIIMQLFMGVSYLKQPLELIALFKLESSQPLQSLESPMISIGKGETVTNVLPTALRFWDKIALTPKGGKKDVQIYAMFEDEGEDKLAQVEAWLATMSTAYASKHFGTHTLGELQGSPRPGLVPLRFDSFRKSLASFLASLPQSPANLVIYISPPAHIMSLASPVMRQVLGALRKAQADTRNILFHFVPDSLISNPISQSSSKSDCVTIAQFVYDRVLQPVYRPSFQHTEPTRRFFQATAFTLARADRTTVSFSRPLPGYKSLDVIDRYTLLHVAYHVAPGGKWIIAAITDERGENHDISVWLTEPEDEGDGGMRHVIRSVWKFATEFAKRADIEWRVNIAKMGPMDIAELNLWSEFLSTTVQLGEDLAMVHVSLLSVESEVPWVVIAPPPIRAEPSTNTALTRQPLKTVPAVFVDVSSTTYALSSITAFPIFPNAPSSNRDIGFEIPFVPDCENQEVSPFVMDSVPIIPEATTTLLRVPVDAGHSSISMLHVHLLYSVQSTHCSPFNPAKTHADVVKNYHDLSVLAKSRGMRSNNFLPFHLAAVDLMRSALDRSEFGEG